MPITDSPLRYPGGKTKLYSLVRPIIEQNVGTHCIYVEPFAGGAGLALKLLYRGDVRRVVLNDIDDNIYCFWSACLHNTDDLCRMVHDCTPSISLWDVQRKISRESNGHSMLERAFATLYLNRCNVSGVISGGPIGGRHQNGKYKIDARFNRIDLVRKITEIGKHQGQITFYNLDASQFILEVVPELAVDDTLINIDPPYVNKGPMLYRNAFSRHDHMRLSAQIKDLDYKWMVTYDECPLVQELYNECNMSIIELKYSAGQTKSGKEYIITSDDIFR